ncbi:MAG: PAS domain S-box protein, partial [Alphaproteobacteria bacterium]|nr:PAS domain S-box protein [Alphaproteobacteria bacterium]
LVWCIVVLTTITGGVLLVRQTGRLLAARETLGHANRELDFYKYALDHHAIVGITDVAGNIVYANDKFCDISKYDREELVGQNHRILNSGVHPKAFFRDIWRAIARGEVWRGEICNRAKDGSLYWVDTAIVPLPNERGRPFRYFAIRIDVTQRKQMEVDLVAAKTEAEAANRFRGELLANTSHELRTPLNAVIGFSDILKTEAFGPLSPKYREYAADINNAGRHLLRLVNDILDMSAIDAGKLDLAEERLDLVDLLKDVTRLINHRAEAGGIELRAKIPEKLPFLVADERRIKQITLNLLSNAIKFNAPGGSVTLAAGRTADGSLFFSVADTGVGMDEEEVAVAMSRFGQVDSSLARKHEGTGLGLPLAHELVELHGGRFEIASAKGRGTTVTVTFPPERTVRI